MSAIRDSLGDRMKAQYECRTRYLLPRRTWTVIRCDGKAFHTFTRGCEKPFDGYLHAAMMEAAVALCEEVQGAKIAYLQSDEISVALSDFDRIETQAWFDGNVQKQVSVAASVVTAAFNFAYANTERALFDARAFTIPDPVEVENYFIWRQKDAIRNSVQALAQCHFSQKQLNGADQQAMHAMLAQKGISWSEAPVHVQRGTVIRRVVDGERAKWLPDNEAPVFTTDRDYLRASLVATGAEAER